MLKRIELCIQKYVYCSAIKMVLHTLKKNNYLLAFEDNTLLKAKFL